MVTVSTMLLDSGCSEGPRAMVKSRKDGMAIASGNGWAFDMLRDPPGPGLSTKTLRQRSGQ